MSAAANPQVRKLFDETRRRLVETGTRNRLVHVNRANTRGAVINIEDERSDDVYQMLSGGRTMRFRPLGKDRHQQGEILLSAAEEVARTMPKQSLGIVTFSVAQKHTINLLLENARRDDKVLDEFLREGGAEDVFVKNIENVQGDERDVIFISVGYSSQSSASVIRLLSATSRCKKLIPARPTIGLIEPS